MKPTTLNLLKELPATAHGQALRDFLEVRLTELDSVTACTSLDDMLARQKAILLIKDIFAFYTPKIEHKKKHQYV